MIKDKSHVLGDSFSSTLEESKMQRIHFVIPLVRGARISLLTMTMTSSFGCGMAALEGQ